MKKITFSLIINIFFFLVSILYSYTPSGTEIINSAKCKYEDQSGKIYNISSNLVIVKVLQIYGIEIKPDGTVENPGQIFNDYSEKEIFIPYTLKNRGNGLDTYYLWFTNLPQDNGNLENVKIYIDLNKNGKLDSGENLYDNDNPPKLLVDEIINLLIIGNLPDFSGKILVNLSGYSNGDNLQKDIDNVSQINFVSDSFVTATKSVDKRESYPNDIVKFTINFQNSGNSPLKGIEVTTDFDNNQTLEIKRGLLISDNVPLYTTYILGTGNGKLETGFTVINKGDGVWRKETTSSLTNKTQKAKKGLNLLKDENNIVAIGFFIPEDSKGNVLYPGQGGYFEFQVKVNSNAPKGTLVNQAEISYSNNSGNQKTSTNQVFVEIKKSAKIIIDDTDDNDAYTGSGVYTDSDDLMIVESATGGGVITFLNEAWNFGYDLDIVNLEFDKNASLNIPEGLTVNFFKTDGSLLQDNDKNGILDTGYIQKNTSFKFLTKVYLENNTLKKDIIIALKGTSHNDPFNTDYTFNKITKVSPVEIQVKIKVTVNVKSNKDKLSKIEKSNITEENFKNGKVIVYAYKNNTLTHSKIFGTDENGKVVYDETGKSSPLYNFLEDGYLYRLTLKEEYNGFTYYLTSSFEKSYFDKPGLYGDIVVEKQGDTILLITPLDPSGYVYDGIKGTKIDGACVTLYRCFDESCDKYNKVSATEFNNLYSDGKTPQENPQITGNSNVGKGKGAFEFRYYQANQAIYGTYFIEVDFSCNLLGSDKRLGETYQPIRLNKEKFWSPYDLIPYRGEKFNIDNNVLGAIFMKIPLIPEEAKPIEVDKTVNTYIAYYGDILKFTINVKNPNNFDIYDVTLFDELPNSLRYKEKSAKIGNKPMEPIISKNGLLLTWENIGDIKANSSIQITYLAYIIASASEKSYTNTTYATGWYDESHSLKTESNKAYASFKVKKDVFSEKAYIIGKVFIDDNDNKIHDEGEQGVRGVKIYMEDGRYVVTDNEGKYHIDNVNPGTHVLKVDETTLPPNSKLEIVNNRNMGSPSSMFVDLFSGEMFKANFRIAPKKPDVLLNVESIAGEGELYIKRSIDSILTDPTTEKITLRHKVIIKNKTKLPLYEVQYIEESPFIPNKGTSYFNNSPLIDPEIISNKEFKWKFPILEPEEEFTIKFNSEIPNTDATAQGKVIFRVNPSGIDLNEYVNIPIVLTREKEDDYKLTVYFDFGKDILTDEAKSSLDKVINLLRRKDYKKIFIAVKGYTDAIRIRPGSQDLKTNLDLSQRRANAVLAYLKANLIDVGKVTIENEN